MLRSRTLLLELFYVNKISRDLFADEEKRTNDGIEAPRSRVGTEEARESRSEGLADRFEGSALGRSNRGRTTGLGRRA
jgi:hypothetical protein